MSDEVLMLPRMNCGKEAPLILEVDASTTALGAILKQKDVDGVERAIAYMGRPLNKYEKNASQVMLEMAALVYGVTAFDRLLSHTEFIIRTDNLALSHLHSLKYAKSSKLVRWGLLLSQYRFTLQHIGADRNQMADCISRMPIESKPTDNSKPQVNEGPAFGLDPILCLSPISDEYFLENKPVDSN